VQGRWAQLRIVKFVKRAKESINKMIIEFMLRFDKTKKNPGHFYKAQQIHRNYPDYFFSPEQTKVINSEV
jgi:hypothetical protein